VELAVLAVDRASEQDIAEIKHRLEAMRFHQHDPVEYGRADVEFHLSVAKAAKNVFLRNVLRTLRRVLQELIAKLELLAIEDMPNAFQVHVPIYEAIKSRNPVAARQAVLAHFNRLERKLQEAGVALVAWQEIRGE